jgi:hypothetical protein
MLKSAEDADDDNTAKREKNIKSKYQHLPLYLKRFMLFSLFSSFSLIFFGVEKVWLNFKCNFSLREYGCE